MGENKQDGGGLRYNEGKPMYDLITPKAMEELAKVLTEGAKKYEPNNWQRGMPWSSVLASLIRHLEAFKRGEDYDQETGLLHMGHVLCNAMFLTEYYSIYPQGDDRAVKYLQPKRIGLDIDDVIADTINHVMKREGWTERPMSFNDPRFKDFFKKVKDDKEFWLTIPVKGRELRFDPCCYVTSRSIPKEWTQEWLDKNLFPRAPLYSSNGKSKVEILKELDIDIFVEDNYSNFVEINNAGIFCYLLNESHNEVHDVGHRRIYSLDALVGKSWIYDDVGEDKLEQIMRDYILQTRLLEDAPYDD